MKILVISDIHGNYLALEAVLADAGTYDAVWCLGDLVGYGPQPNECVERIRGMSNLICLLGNHDAASLGGLDLEDFNNEAMQSVQWMMDHLSEENKAYLGNLPEKYHYNAFTLVHGSPRYPIWEYILNTEDARRNFPFFTTRYCLVGHSHVPCLFQQRKKGDPVHMEIPQTGIPVQLKPRSIINPGSVGQPRDHNPGACYATLDLEQYIWELHRVSYNYQQVQKLIVEAGLPIRNAARLEGGW
ncbi:MAG: metallophosphoesterase family protein [Anaerolineaceae bacterium]|nr:metallophosphoesterase family protein [Anaerolineaceae bacterium]MBN2677979.1 metallophosphoesterase family protein [Anaerolineaceae bacterium]